MAKQTTMGVIQAIGIGTVAGTPSLTELGE